jgi:hypothetical protein
MDEEVRERKQKRRTERRRRRRRRRKRRTEDGECTLMGVVEKHTLSYHICVGRHSE